MEEGLGDVNAVSAKNNYREYLLWENFWVSCYGDKNLTSRT